MKKTASALAFLAVGSIVNAADLPLPAQQLDIVNFQMSAKQWVNTQTALLTVTLNATLGNSDLVKARADIMAKLTKIAPGDWHLTRFDRSQDGSGLEKLDARAEARVAQNALTQVYVNAKSVSKPGESYQIGAIEFKPSLEETEQARVQLRECLYQQAQEELARLNKLYTTQQYSLNNLVFVEGDDNTSVKPDFQTRVVNAMATGSGARAVTVSNELMITALVQVASNRLQGNSCV